MPCSVGKGSHDQCLLLVSVKGRLPRDVDIPPPECASGYQKLRCVRTDWRKSLRAVFRQKEHISGFSSLPFCHLEIVVCPWKGQIEEARPCHEPHVC